MKLVVISDTHLRHEHFGRLQGDVLIHCGDMFDLFEEDGADMAAMDRWFGEQDFDLVLCTGGNHDLPLERALQRDPQPFRNAVYLQDDAYTYQGKVFWGSPWVPDLPYHAFHASSRELVDKWSRIPVGVDVLITHTPPRSILDESSGGYALGCHDLMQAVNHVKPSVHCFGHIHHSRGELQRRGIRFINACSVQRGVDGVLDPVVVEL
ncbi:MAG: metallophosphoesterase family protein [Pseudomonadota bacterium]